MTQEEINDYNCMCAEFLGFKIDEETQNHLIPIKIAEISDFKEWADTKNINGIDYYLLSENQLCFNFDWNWITEVVEKIESLGVNFWVVKNRVTITLVGKLAKRLEYASYNTEFYGYDFEGYNGVSKKEAVIMAINDFLIWYNKNK